LTGQPNGAVRGGADMDSVSRCCWRINKYSQRFWNERCLAIGIGIGQVPFLSLLFRKENLSQEEITGYLSIDKAAVTKTAAKLLERKLIERKEDPADARVRRITLTKKGRALEPFLSGLEEEWDSLLLAGFSREERASIRAFLGRVRDNAVHANGHE
jgi:DNA-binding MarR family transcriptional regulator